MDIIRETKQKFSIAWKDNFASSELPSLDFLNDSDQAYEQFRHSKAVINDCLATIKVEVFIVKFLCSHILSEGKCASDLKLGFNVGEITTDLESIFPGKTDVDGSTNDGNGTSKSVGQTGANLGRIAEGNEAGLLDKTSTSVKSKVSVKRDLHDTSYENDSPNFVKHENEESMNVLEAKGNDNLDESRRQSDRDKEGHPSAEIGQQSVSNGQVTIFTPIPDDHIENKSKETKNESTTTPNLSPVKDNSVKLDRTGLDTNSPEKQSYNMVHETKGEDDLQSSGNELETFTDDPFSSCSNSPDPVHEHVFLEDEAHGSGEIIKIMPVSARSTSFFSVDPAVESTHFGTAEHIYEDIDRYRTVPDGEYNSETRRHLSQSENTLMKTFSVGALDKPKDGNDDVFLNKDGSSPKGEQRYFKLRFNSCRVHYNFVLKTYRSIDFAQ